ncbi:MAG TPA: FlgD immunoglobulin-like domain containing protein, partial [Candidatus Krumholzibacteria bacterium]|nr:FlgD immunoglobulin-like domain containing protein [Candidatus Krumholzibacteria bacterium]
PQIISSDGNLIVAWEDQRWGAANGFDIFAQRLSVVGAPQWVAQGLPVTEGSGSQRFFDMAPSGDGGALFAWRDERNSVATSHDVYAQRLNADGSRLYTSHGAPVCVQAGSQYDPRIVSDGASGAYVVWRDSRPGDAYSATIYYAQRLTGDGYGIWTSDGITLAAEDGYQDHVVIERDQAGRLAAVWTDTRDNVYSNLFGQIVSPAGSRLLGFSGTAVSLAPFNQGPLALAIDDRNGIIATFLDDRTSVFAYITEQRLDASGYLGDPAPVALSVTDAPQDQGGLVLLEWQRSWLDDPYQTGISGYSVWRRWTGGAKAVVDPALAADLAAQLGADPAAVTDHLKAGWTYVGETPAQEFAAYGFDAPTYADSTGAGEAPTEFQVVAVGYSGQLWHSNAVSGHSVDNLAPGAPLQLAGMLNGAEVDLDWTPAGVNDEDLDGYRIYRAATPGVIPGAGTFVGTAADTLYTDAAPPSGPLYYVVTAVDVHGNEGDPSNEVMLESVTGVDHDGLPGRFALAGASPNPFNPATELRLDVPREGRVVLTIHDARGAVVRTLQDARLTAGRHAVRWDGRADDGRAVASGAYFARARFGDGATSTAKLLLAR